MFMSFERFQYLNESDRPSRDVRYRTFLDKEGTVSLVFDGSTGMVAAGTSVAPPLPAPMQGIRSVRVSAWIARGPGQPPELADWVLTSETRVEDTLRGVEVAIGTASQPNVLRATARLLFQDGASEERVRLFSM